jgi:glycosyltransferase involved in cell wall biosynthesis
MADHAVSVVIPTRNEELHIEECLESVLSQDYPALREVLVVDGMSKDRTREIAAAFAAREPRVKVLQNPGIIPPCAVNAGIRAATGEVVVRLDAHSAYPRDYVSRCVRLLESTGAANAGGVVETVPNGDGPWAMPVARVTSHRFGVGGAAFRTGGAPGFVDTVPFGTFRRSLFDEVGFFDERLVRGEDYEFNGRLRKAGYKIAFDPGIRIRYKNQATLLGLCRQAYHTSMWNVFATRLHPHFFAPRRFVPAAFVAYLAALPFLPGLWPPLGLYAAIAVFVSMDAARPVGENLRTAWTFFAYHACYGAGLWVGLFSLATGRWTRLIGRPLRP